MATEKMCAVCNQNAATKDCAECGKPLCEMCAKEVRMEMIEPSHRIKGVSIPGATAPEVRIKIVCPDCLRKVDIF